MVTHIREEKNDQFSLVGIVPDNIGLSARKSGNSPPDAQVRVIPKISLYIRVHFDPAYDLPVPVARLVPPDGQVIPLGQIDPSVVKNSKAQAIEKGNLLAGVVIRATLMNFPVPKFGNLRVEVVLGDDVYLAGALNMGDADAVISSTEPPQPS